MEIENVDVFNAAVVQITPTFLDNEETIKKVERQLTYLHSQECRLVLFPESIFPGYPRGFTFGATVGRRTEAGRDLWLRYYETSLLATGPEAKLLSQMAGDFNMHLIIGVTEKDKISSTLYCSTFHFAPDGQLKHVHRKVKPTGTERVIWGEGDGSCIQSVDTELGRVGGLICWENYMPEARMKLYRSGLDIYLAPTADARDTWLASMQHIACESRSYVLSSNQYFRKSDYSLDLQELLDHDQSEILCRGGSCIVSPLGKVLAGPIYDREDSLITKIDRRDILKSRMDFDVIGHYRPQSLSR
ncbi:MAG: carbon-nitrogen hydrolase family protein [Saprospiraceae bacterium]|nr:carbon-nitrogen hydrolase family protein [Saprospiraceae bacterium]